MAGFFYFSSLISSFPKYKKNMRLESLVSENIRNFYPGEVFIVFQA